MPRFNRRMPRGSGDPRKNLLSVNQAGLDAPMADLIADQEIEGGVDWPSILRAANASPEVAPISRRPYRRLIQKLP